MASNQAEVEIGGRDLKRLGFVRFIAIKSLVLASNLYDYAKKNAGPLRSSVGTVESTVTTVVGPVYEKYRNVPGDVLAFFDEKVDEAANKFNERAPPSAKEAVGKAQTLIHKASEAAQTIVEKAQTGGPSEAIHYAGALYMQLFLYILARFWYVSNKVPPLHQLAEIVVPTVAHWSEKYNKTVVDLTNKGYSGFSHLPQIPIDDIAKACKQIEAEKVPVSGSESDSD